MKIRKIASLLVVFCLLVAPSLQTSASDDHYVEYSFVCDETVSPGENIVIGLYVESNCPVDGLLLYNFAFDSEIAEFVGFGDYGALVTNSLMAESSISGGMINLGYLPSVVPDGKICSLTFKIKEDTPVGSELSVSMSASASKDRKPAADNIVSPSCVVAVVEKIILGDFDSDGFFTSDDLIYACQLYADIIDETAGNVAALDVDGENGFTSDDLIYMCQYYADIISEWPAEAK